MSVETTKEDLIEVFEALGTSNDPDPKKPLGTLELREVEQSDGTKTVVLSRRWSLDKAPIGEQSGDFVFGRLRGVPFISCRNAFRTMTVINLTRWPAGTIGPPRPWFVRGDRLIGTLFRGDDEISLASKVLKGWPEQ